MGERPTVALVTGSARGLGLASARRLADEGALVHVHWRTGERPPDALVEAFGRRVHRADLARPEEARALVEAVLALDGRLDVLVHAVGDYHEAELADDGATAVERMWRSNVATAVACMDAARPALRAGGRGSAVFFGLAGLDGLRARERSAAYAAAKSALLVLVRSWAREEAPHGLRVYMVSPGVVPHDHAHPATLDEALLARIPSGRAGRPEEVAAAVAFLCSAEAAHTTGADLPVAGGWML